MAESTSMNNGVVGYGYIIGSTRAESVFPWHLSFSYFREFPASVCRVHMSKDMKCFEQILVKIVYKV